MDIRRYFRYVIVIVVIFLIVIFKLDSSHIEYFGSMLQIGSASVQRLIDESQWESNSTATTMTSRLKFNTTTRAYELNGKPIIWQYWDKDTAPLYNRLLLEAFRCRNPEFELIQVHASNVFQFLPDLAVPKKVFRLLYPAHQADVFRLHILATYGGVYMDNDVYALDKLYPQYELLRNVDLIIGDCGNPGKYDYNFGGMGPSRVNASHIRIWADAQADAIMKYFRDDSVISATKTDPFGWTQILYDVEMRVESAMRNETSSGRTKLHRYQGRSTCYQVVDRVGPHSAHFAWSNVSSKLLPLGWSPFLFVWGEKMREMYSPITNLTKIFPKEETIYSVFVGCALLDCRHEYERLSAANVSKTQFDLDVEDLLIVLENVNQSICRQVRNDSRLNEFEKFMLKD